MKLAHFVITRFCLRGMDGRLFRDVDGPAYGSGNPLKPRTVDLRLKLLEMLCLPGLSAQTNQDFTWVLLVDAGLEEGVKARLREMTRAKDRVLLHEHRPDAPDRLETLGWLDPLLSDRPDYVLTTINDDDDALPRRFVDVVQSHAFALNAQGRLPPVKLMGVNRIDQWDLVFTRDAPWGWAVSRSGVVSTASCGFSLLCRYPAFDFSVLGMRHYFAMKYLNFQVSPPRENVRFYRQAFLEAARDARVGRVPMGNAAFFDAGPRAGAVLMSNHGANYGKNPRRSGVAVGAARTIRSENGSAARRKVLGAETFPDVRVDWTAVRRHATHFAPGEGDTGRGSSPNGTSPSAAGSNAGSARGGVGPAAMTDGAHEAGIRGALHDLERIVTTHLFIICPNNSGSTFLQNALATSRRTWNLSDEGWKMGGVVRPSHKNDRRLFGSNRIWAARRRWRDVHRNPAHSDWPRNRTAWYFQSWARDPRALVFVEKTPEHLLVVGDLARHFRNAKFLFMVRNPYAVCEGICRVLRSRGSRFPQPALEGERLETVAARHVATCLEVQRRNVEAYGDRGVFFTYEAMCREPERVARKIRDLVPELDDLNLRQRLPVRGRYHEILTDMNARQIARLDAGGGGGQIAAIDRELRKHRAVLHHFGYEIMEPGR